MVSSIVCGRSDPGVAQIVHIRISLVSYVACQGAHWAHAGFGIADRFSKGRHGDGVFCIPVCVAGSWLAQGLALLECAVGSWLAKRTASTAETALLPLGLFSPGLGLTLAISLLVGAMLLW